MQNEKLIYSEQVKLVASQFDLNDNITPTAILSLFQDIACVHGEMIGVGYENMLQKGLYWVLIRTKYDVLCSPKPYQQVIVETWPHVKGRVDFDRDYLIKDIDGKVLIKGTSKWCVISTETRKLMLPTAVEYPKELEYETKVNYQDKFAKTPSIERQSKPIFEHIVAYHEIDHNKHLNNVNYATYVFDAMQKDDLTHMQINFIAECHLNDKIELFSQLTDDGVLVAGYVGQELKFTALAK